MHGIIHKNRLVFGAAVAGVLALSFAEAPRTTTDAQNLFGRESAEAPAALRTLALRQPAPLSINPQARSGPRDAVVLPATPVRGLPERESAEAPDLLRPAPRPAAEPPVLAAVSTRAVPFSSPRPMRRSVGVGLRAWSYGPAERAQLGGLIDEAAGLVETPPTTLAGASDLACLAVSVYHEARDQPRLGQRAVASVILRRAELPRWGETVCDVVQPVQFSYLTRDRRFAPILERAAWREALTVAIATLMEGPATSVAEADHYHATYVRPEWRTEMRRLVQIGAHVFYRDPRSRLPEAAEPVTAVAQRATIRTGSGG